MPDANYIIAGTGYFRTLRLSLRRGRAFNDADSQTGAGVAIVNEELARLHWPGQDPLGKRLRIEGAGNDPPWRTIVGVAGNVLTQGVDEGVHAEIYIPYQQFPWMLGGPQHLLIRTVAGTRPEDVVHAVVREIKNIDAGLPVADIQTLDQIAAEPLAQQRMVMALLISFASLALILSACGIYGVLSYAIAQRTREIGVRVALGAQPKALLRLVVGGGLRLAGLGIVLGTAAAFFLTGLMRNLLYGVRPTDLFTFVAAAVALTATSLIACYVPARRALRIDPLAALRHE